MSAVPSARPRPLQFTAFATNATGHAIPRARFPIPARQSDFDELERWVRLARTLERGRFDALFLADAVAHHAAGRRDERGPIEARFQAPGRDPSVLAGAIAYVTDHLGIAFTASTRCEHPSAFARRISALDRASNGRIAWNIPADDPPSPWAEEYVDVTYKLWEGSWDDDALRQYGRPGSRARDGKVHRINHRGPRYTVEGPHLASPTPQRTPLLFHADAPADGRAFGARNAEAVFIRSPVPAAVAGVTADIRSRAASHGRPPEDIKFFQSLHVVTGGTEAEASRKAAEWEERTADAARLSLHTAGGRIAGTPEQIADEFARWQDAGVDGINLVSAGDPGPYEEFVDHVVPVLQDRGLMQREYADGTLRHKFFGHGDRLPERHPAARYRGAFTPRPAPGADEAELSGLQARYR
jgi:alkanesulfonate monooxygenase SsuD/methylene tetrahydromethanopterin reductase-like flavin-dependent oxidoreductase (luciferase family)